MAAHSLEELLVEQLRDMYDSEQRLTKALPKLMKAAQSAELKNAFLEHTEQTEEHVRYLERIFETLEMTPRKKSCKAMIGLLEEGEEMMKEEMDGPVRDAALIAAAQKVEHYEIATYGCLYAWAGNLNMVEAERLFDAILEEEKEADDILTNIALTLNMEAAEEAVRAEAAKEERGRS